MLTRSNEIRDFRELHDSSFFKPTVQRNNVKEVASRQTENLCMRKVLL